MAYRTIGLAATCLATHHTRTCVGSWNVYRAAWRTFIQSWKEGILNNKFYVLYLVENRRTFSLHNSMWFHRVVRSIGRKKFTKATELGWVGYIQLPLTRTHSGPAPTVCLGEVSALEGDEVND